MKEGRKLLIEQIRAAGMEIVQRADEMLGEDAEYITNFKITAEFPPREAVTITWEAETISMKAMEVQRRNNG